MAYNIEFFIDAETDLDEAVTWYTSQSPDTATRFLDEYIRLEQEISIRPPSFPIVYRDTIRKARFRKPFPYSILFFLHKNTIYIVSVFHDKRNPERWKSRVQ